MRRLSFRGFLSQYIRALSATDTNNIRILANKVCENHRLVEPLILFAMANKKTDYLKRVAHDTVLCEVLAHTPTGLSWGEVQNALADCDPSFSTGFHKVYSSYISVRDRVQSNNHTKKLMHSRILDLKNKKQISNYRLYTDLKINHGNLNSYLKHGDVSKVGLNTAEKVLQYLTSI